MSLIYITHDLTTAYQISDNILVLYRGSVREGGDVEHVVQEPKDPYTRLLVGSIPMPDPDRPWIEEEGASEIGRRADIGVSCKFADRCPYAMEMCLDQRPPLYQVDSHRVAACHLYRDRPTISGDGISDIFVEPTPITERTAAD